jgi:hypothetical protein
MGPAAGIRPRGIGYHVAQLCLDFLILIAKTYQLLRFSKRRIKCASRWLGPADNREVRKLRNEFAEDSNMETIVNYAVALWVLSLIPLTVMLLADGQAGFRRPRGWDESAEGRGDAATELTASSR